MNRRDAVKALAAAAATCALPLQAQDALPPLQVYKSPSCGCCAAWVDHMKAAGFRVEVFEVGDTGVARRRLGLPIRYASCHTAVVAGYVVEGHVPADEVKRLLRARPDAIGLAVPAMPVGSPGMEMDGRQDPYQVLLIDRAGRDSVYASYPKG